MNSIFYMAAFLLAIGILIVVHEFGHYLAARLCGVRVLRFSLGFGPALWTRIAGKDRTEWTLSAVPLGGYVKMLDEREASVDAHELHRAFNTQSLLKRCFIVAAGPVFNLLLAVAIYWGIACVGGRDMGPQLGRIVAGSPAAQAGLLEGDMILRFGERDTRGWSDLRWAVMRNALRTDEVTVTVRHADGGLDDVRLALSGVKIEEKAADPMQQLGLSIRPTLPAVLGQPLPGGAGAQAGLRAGDLVRSVDGKHVQYWHELVELIAAAPRRPLLFSVERDGALVNVSVTPEGVGPAPQRGLIRVPQINDEAFFVSHMTEIRYGLLAGAGYSVRHTADMAIFQLRAMWHIATGKMSWRNISGPVSIADAAGQSAKTGVDVYLGLIAALSVSLGVLNLLPIPILDGGHILYYVIERIRGRALSAAAEAFSQRVGLAILALLMSLAFFNDLNRVLFG
ncbi:RIP metalloprotease RseP [Uliginosibacterium sp. 31-16]|uniref:RIP metalloprotease RseP n=1 Tax=Uliginosibacterium sp. 31-16 TaxID=3068315 RepID=UPI00273DF76A|nr:RIP metalloprotease RseP [Uliginosibacterium sp. 31-16]MDP5240516.1 RIP metalloprotease RseP [Uliginosibacterium sp. 31-16]